MIDNISSSSMMQSLLQAQETSSTSSTSSTTSASLTTTQEETIASILESYDADNLSESDAQAIVAAFEDAGIEPSSELESAMSEAGFSAQEVGTLAGVGPQEGGMPPPPSAEEVDTISSLLDSILTSDEDEEATATTSFEEIMDYTSQILSLNEDSKTEVMDLLSKYSDTSSEDSEYTQDETNSIIKNSLSQILADSDNYNTTSFYG